jgi:hypothetical protein
MEKTKQFHVAGSRRSINMHKLKYAFSIFGILLGVTITFSNTMHISLFQYDTTYRSDQQQDGTAGNRNAATGLQTRMTKYINTYNYTLPTTTTTPLNRTDEQCGTGPDYNDFFKLKHTERSRFNEDKTIYETIFKNKLNATGTYVELGAYDGSKESNSRFFDLCLGWKGLLIEGNPHSYKKVLLSRPRAHRMSFAPSCSAQYEAENGTVLFYRYALANVGLVGKAKTYEGKSTLSVPCGPLSPVLQDVFNGERITFFSLDVEGAELTVLETIDFDKVLIEVMMIEIKNSDCGDICEHRDMVRAKMKELGYKKYEGVVLASDVHIHPRSRYQMPGAAASEI